MSRISQVEHCFLKAPQLLPCPRFFHGLNQAWILTTSHDGSHHRSDHASYYAVYRPITIGLRGKGTGECINADAYSYTLKMYIYILHVLTIYLVRRIQDVVCLMAGTSISQFILCGHFRLNLLSSTQPAAQ